MLLLLCNLFYLSCVQFSNHYFFQNFIQDSNKSSILNLKSVFISLKWGIFTVLNFSLVAVSVDRFWAIYFPISYRNNTGKKSTLCTIFVCWSSGFAGLFLLAESVTTEIKTDRGILGYDCSTIYGVFVLFIPTVVIVLVYALIYIKLNSMVSSIFFLRVFINDLFLVAVQNKKRAMLGLSNLTDTQNSVTKTLSMIVGSFLICWMPMIFCLLFAKNHDKKLNEKLWMLIKMLPHFNSAIDPIIYAYRIKDVRDAVKALFRCGKMK